MARKLKFTRVDGDYVCAVDDLDIRIWNASADRSWGLTVRRWASDKAETLVPEKGWGIYWMRTKSACVAEAEKFVNARAA